MPKPTEVLKALASLLGKGGVLAAMPVGDVIRLSIRDEVVVPKQLEPLVLFLSSRTTLDAELVLRKLTGEDGIPLTMPAEISRSSVRYSGSLGWTRRGQHGRSWDERRRRRGGRLGCRRR